MSKTHCVALAKMPETWDGQRIQALCGKWVVNARPVFKVNFETFQVEGMNTLQFCEVCFPLAMAPVEDRKYIVGILPAEEAMKANNELEQ